MLKSEAKQLNFHSQLYNNIPEKHILKRINSAISLEFVNDLLKGSYCSNFGRPAKEPEMMMRILILQYLYNLSDEKVIDELQVNLAYMWFIGINPGDKPPHSSLLSKFRTTRLQDISLDEIIQEIIKQCIEKKIIEETDGISIDATHIQANTVKKTPERIMKHLAQKIFKATGKENYEIPNYKEIENHTEAKQVMKDYLIQVIQETEENEITKEVAQKEIQEAKEILESPLFIEQKGIRSLIDKEARVGHKTTTENFFGYKNEYCQTTQSGLITAVNVNHGAHVDGIDFIKLYEQTQKTGINIAAVLGDKAYFKIGILEYLEKQKNKIYIPPNPSSYRVDEELYQYNKDSDQWYCKEGNETIEVKISKDKKSMRYIFRKEQCRNCPNRQACIGKAKTIAKRLHVSINSPQYYKYSQQSKTEEFKEEFKKRARIEGKNGEMKRFHGLARARGYGLRSVSFQAKLTAIAVNLKRIAKLISSKIFKFILHNKKILLEVLNSSNKIFYTLLFQ